MADPDQRQLMVDLIREHGDRFGTFNTLYQPPPDPDRYEPYPTEPDREGNHDPRYLYEPSWFADTVKFLRGRYSVLDDASLFFTCQRKRCRGPISDDPKESAWYRRSIRMGYFRFQGMIGIGFSCASVKCGVRSCDLNHQNPDCKMRVDIYGLLAIFEGITRTAAVKAVSDEVGVPLHGFGKPHAVMPRESFWRLVHNYRTDPPRLIKNFRNQCARAPLAYFDRKAPTETADDNFFFRSELFDRGTLTAINHASVWLYLFLLTYQMEELRHNRWSLRPLSAEVISSATGVPVRTVRDHLNYLLEIGLVAVQKSISGNAKPALENRAIF